MPLTPGSHLWDNYRQALVSGSERGSSAPVSTMLFNSFVAAISIAVGKIAISILSAFAIVYFRFPLRNFFFWMIFVTLMLPVEVRIIPTFKVVADLGMLDSYAGLTLPLIASATATSPRFSRISRKRASSAASEPRSNLSENSSKPRPRPDCAESTMDETKPPVSNPAALNAPTIVGMSGASGREMLSRIP